jgi:hypothetical protein
LVQEPELRGVVLSGAGEKAFIGGTTSSNERPCRACRCRAIHDHGHRRCNALRQLPAPVIARLSNRPKTLFASSGKGRSAYQTAVRPPSMEIA